MSSPDGTIALSREAAACESPAQQCRVRNGRRIESRRDGTRSHAHSRRSFSCHATSSRTASRNTFVCRSTSSLSVCGDISAML